MAVSVLCDFVNGVFFSARAVPILVVIVPAEFDGVVFCAAAAAVVCVLYCARCWCWGVGFVGKRMFVWVWNLGVVVIYRDARG
jgi:hypothetical protein